MLQARTAAAVAVVTMTSLIPYSLFINAHEYFYYKLRNATDLSIVDDNNLLRAMYDPYRNNATLGTEPTTDLQRTYEGWFTVTSGITCILGSLVNTVATNRLSNSFRVVAGHAIVLLALMPTLFYTFIDTDDDQAHFFWMSMLFSSISSFASVGLIGAGIQGLAATLSASYVKVVMLASATANIATSVLSIVCQAATSSSILNGRIYFGIAFLWTILSLLCYLFLLPSEHAKEIDERSEDDEPLVDDKDDEEEDETEGSVVSDNSPREDNQEISSRPQTESPSSEASSASLFDGWPRILEQSGPDLACTMFIIIVTCAAYPALVSQVRTQTLNATWRAYFSSICCFLLYSCSDGLGRIFAMRINISRRHLQNLSLARLLLLPLIAVCDVQPRHHSPTLIRNDAVFVLLNMTLALSFGFCYTHAYVKAVQSVEPELREKTGSMLSLTGNVVGLIGNLMGVAIVTFV